MLAIFVEQPRVSWKWTQWHRNTVLVNVLENTPAQSIILDRFRQNSV